MSLYPMSSPESRQSIPELIRQLFQEMLELMRQHIELTKTEVREEGKRISKAVVFGGSALLLGLVALIFLGTFLVTLLMSALDLSSVASTLVVTLLFFAVTGVFGWMCLKEIRSARDLLKPEP